MTSAIYFPYKSRLPSLILLLSFILPLKIYADSSTRQPVALEIYLYDNLGFVDTHADYYKRVFSVLQPQMRYHLIKIDGRDHRSPEAIRTELIEALNSALQPDEEVSFLLISTHGNNFFYHGNENYKIATTHMKHIGLITEIGVGQSFSEIFTPLQKHIGTSLQIVINACHAFCSSEETAQKVAQVLFDFFGAENGNIYGSNVNETSPIYGKFDFFHPKYLSDQIKPVLFRILSTSLLLIPIATYFALLTNQELLTAKVIAPGAIINEIKRGITYSFEIGSFISLLFSILDFVTHHKESLNVYNQGFYFSFKDRKLISTQTVTKHEQMAKWISQNLTWIENATLTQSSYKNEECHKLLND